jgi:hypothetical protein
MDFEPYESLSTIRCSCSDNSTKLVKLICNKHLSSISYMKVRYVGSENMCFMTANIKLA